MTNAVRFRRVHAAAQTDQYPWSISQSPETSIDMVGHVPDDVTGSNNPAQLHLSARPTILNRTALGDVCDVEKTLQNSRRNIQILLRHQCIMHRGTRSGVMRRKVLPGASLSNVFEDLNPRCAGKQSIVVDEALKSSRRMRLTVPMVGIDGFAKPQNAITQPSVKFFRREES